MVCPKCSTPQGPLARFCSTCGLPLPKAVPPKRSIGAQLVRGVFFAFLGIGGLILGFLILVGLSAPAREGSANLEDITRTETRGAVVTSEDYSRIEKGMTYAEVCGIIGRSGEELSRSDNGDLTTVMYSWKNRGGANMNAMFQNDRLVMKAQFGLR